MNHCELCGSSYHMTIVKVFPREDEVILCSVCSQLEKLKDENHWRCLEGAIWSERPAVKVLCYRILKELDNVALLGQLFLDEDELAWAEEKIVKVQDSAGTILKEGDSVTLIKDLEVKGAGFTAKRGTLVKNIHLTDDPLHVEGKVNGVHIVLVAKFLKKV
ncbi:MAG: PhnA domain-containing protein [Bacteriovoracales bacterium]